MAIGVARFALRRLAADGGIRTGDILFTREVLYQLSYVGAATESSPG
jgi:hypothetical protein